MASRLRLSGRMLLMGNGTMMSLFLAVGIMLAVCINSGVLIYELVIRGRISFLAEKYMPLADILVSLLLIFMTVAVMKQISLGADRYFLRLSQKNGGTPKDIFYYFHPARALEALFFSFRMSALKSLLLIVAFFPSAICLWLLTELSQGGMSALVALSLAVGCVCFLLSGIFFYRRIIALLFTARYIFISGKYLSFRQILSSSAASMKGNEKVLFHLKRSFCGWFILCVFILPIGYVWNYYRQTLAVAAAKFLDG